MNFSNRNKKIELLKTLTFLLFFHLSCLTINTKYIFVSNKEEMKLPKHDLASKGTRNLFWIHIASPFFSFLFFHKMCSENSSLS